MRQIQVEIAVPYNEERILNKGFLQSQDLDKAKVVVIENGKNPIGLPQLFNTHKRTSTADWLVFCRQDFVVYESGWLNKILSLEPSACYGPIGIDPRGQFLGQIRQTNGKLLGQLAALAEVATLDEMCIILPRLIYEKVDFDDQFLFDFYVSDYCLQAKQLGYPSRILQLDCRDKSRTLPGDIKSERYLKAKVLFLEKYKDVRPLLTTTFQLWPRYWCPPERSPTLAAELQLIGEEKKVLEIGPGGGHMTEALLSRGCNVTCIEINPKLAVKAKPFCEKLIIGDVERLDLENEVRRESFDVILLGDVLEHLKDPAQVLRKIHRFLKPSGYLVVSMPNVAHAGVRLALLNGEFTYQEEGLLDRTHLWFFTLRTIAALFRESGYEIRDLRRIRFGFFNTEIQVDPLKVPVVVLRRLYRDPEASTYQFVFKALKPRWPPENRPVVAGSKPASGRTVFS